MRALLLLLLFAPACVPVLDDDDAIGDDDDSTGDDDDTTIGDDDDSWGDDDDSWGDDDDVIQECGWSEGFIELWSSEGIDYEGTWYEGDVSFSQESVSVVDAAGQEVTFTSSRAWMLSTFTPGAGRVYFWNGGATAFGSDAVLAVETWSPWTRTLLANQAPVPDAVQAEWGLMIEPDRFGCEWELMETECGVSAPLPLWVEMVDPLTGLALSYYLMPGEAAADSATMSTVEHLGGVVNLEVICPDTPELEYAWTFSQSLEGPILGVGPAPAR